VTVETPLELEATASQVITAGEGDVVAKGEQALLHIHVVNGTTGDEAATTYDQGQPAGITMSEDQLFPAVLEALVDKPSGSRVAVAAVPADAYQNGAEQIGISKDDSVVFVVDVMSAAPAETLDAPDGEPADAPGGRSGDLPAIVETDGEIARLDFADAAAEPGKKLTVTTLLQGDGEPIRDESLITIDYVGQVWEAKEPFDNSYPEEPVTFGFGIGQLISGWEKGLLGVKTGSRVMLSIPAADGYGEEGNPSIKVGPDDTMVFVVDVLGVG
jgi:peptidylprolyl isomerase